MKRKAPTFPRSLAALVCAPLLLLLALACAPRPEFGSPHTTPTPLPPPDTAEEVLDRARAALEQLQSFRYVGEARSIERRFDQEWHETHTLEGEWATPDQHFMRQHTVWVRLTDGQEESRLESTAEWVAAGGLVLMSEPGHPELGWRTLPGYLFDSPSRAPLTRIPEDLEDVQLCPLEAEVHGIPVYQVTAAQRLSDADGPPRLVHYDFYIAESTFRLLRYRLILEHAERTGPDGEPVLHTQRYFYDLFDFNAPVHIELPEEWKTVATPTPAPRPTPTPRPTVAPPPPNAPGALEEKVSLDLVLSTDEITVGETVVMDVRMTNESEFPVTVWYGGNSVVLEVGRDEEGAESVWDVMVGGGASFLAWFTLQPGESRMLGDLWNMGPGRWDARHDGDGFPVEPGEYWVRGILRMEQSSLSSEWTRDELETAPQRLMVHASPVPDFAAAVELELHTPQIVASGQPVSVDMAVTNRGEEPIELWFNDTFLYHQGRGHYFTGLVRPQTDVAVFRDGAPFWRAVPTLVHHSCVPLLPCAPRWGLLRLDPGESKLLSELFGTDPWVWEQETHAGEPLPPGTYVIRGVVSVRPATATLQDPEPWWSVATEPHEVRILP